MACYCPLQISFSGKPLVFPIFQITGSYVDKHLYHSHFSMIDMANCSNIYMWFCTFKFFTCHFKIPLIFMKLTFSEIFLISKVSKSFVSFCHFVSFFFFLYSIPDIISCVNNFIS